MSDPVLETDFVKEMVRQMRALDTYGTQGGWKPEQILEPFVMTKERKATIPIIGDPDEITISQVKAFYNAIAVGFGRVLIIVGKLVALDKTLRDVHRFGFESLSKMKTEGDKLLSVAIERVGLYPDVAGL
jgi:hypothetical protein